MRCIRYKEACVACLFQVFRIWRIRVWTIALWEKTSRRACSTQSQRYCLKGIFIVLPQWHKCRTKLKSVWNPCVIRCYIYWAKSILSQRNWETTRYFRLLTDFLARGLTIISVAFPVMLISVKFQAAVILVAAFQRPPLSGACHDLGLEGAWRRHNHRNQFILTLSARYRLVWLYLAQCILSQAIPFLSSLLHWGGVDQALMFPHCTISRLRPRF